LRLGWNADDADTFVSLIKADMIKIRDNPRCLHQLYPRSNKEEMER